MSPRKSYTKQAHEAAFQAWRSCGQNMAATIRELRKQGFLMTEPTLRDWCEKFSWCERAARADAIEQKANDAATLSSEERALASLERIREAYEKSFETTAEGAALDNQAVYAYTNLSKIIIQLSRTKTAGDVKKIAKAGGLSEEKAEEIRRKILGVV